MSRVRSRGSTLVAIIGASVLVVVAAAAVVVTGPSDEIPCGTGGTLDRLAQGVMEPLGGGHIDGAAGSLCVVPSPTAWLIGTLLFLVGLGTILLVASRGRS